MSTLPFPMRKLQRLSNMHIMRNTKLFIFKLKWRMRNLSLELSIMQFIINLHSMPEPLCFSKSNMQSLCNIKRKIMFINSRSVIMSIRLLFKWQLLQKLFTKLQQLQQRLRLLILLLGILSKFINNNLQYMSFWMFNLQPVWSHYL